MLKYACGCVGLPCGDKVLVLDPCDGAGMSLRAMTDKQIAGAVPFDQADALVKAYNTRLVVANAAVALVNAAKFVTG